MSDGTVTAARWVAFGPNGAVGSIHRGDGGYQVRVLRDEEPRGVFPTLALAKNALQAAIPGAERPEFREH